MNESTELSPLNQFLIESIVLDGVQTMQAEDGTLEVDVPAINNDASLFELSRGGARRFYELASLAGRVGLNVHVAAINGGAKFRFFNVREMMLPEDHAEYAFLVELGNELAAGLGDSASGH